MLGFTTIVPRLAGSISRNCFDSVRAVLHQRRRTRRRCSPHGSDRDAPGVPCQSPLDRTRPPWPGPPTWQAGPIHEECVSGDEMNHVLGSGVPKSAKTTGASRTSQECLRASRCKFLLQCRVGMEPQDRSTAAQCIHAWGPKSVITTTVQEQAAQGLSCIKEVRPPSLVLSVCQNSTATTKCRRKHRTHRGPKDSRFYWRDP